MNPILEAQAIAVAGGATEARFGADVCRYLVHGFVVSTPDAFLLLHPTRHDLDIEDMANPSIHPDACDCWFVHTAAGRLDAIVTHVPFWLPLVAFQRTRPVAAVCDRRPSDRVRFYPLDRLRHYASRLILHS